MLLIFPAPDLTSKHNLMRMYRLPRLLSLSLLVAITGTLSAYGATAARQPRVLVFSKTAGYHHASIPDGIAAIMRLGRSGHFRVDTTTDATRFNKRDLKKYAAVIFLSTSGDVLNDQEQQAFENYIQAGGGYLGIHGASATEYDWSWYGQLVGALFSNHPHPVKARLIIHPDARFPVTDSLPNPWIRTDEWYNFRTLPRNVHVLISIDETSYQGGGNGKNHPLVWYHDFEGGRAFYLGMGHTPESYRNPYFLELLKEGIHYATGQT